MEANNFAFKTVWRSLWQYFAVLLLAFLIRNHVDCQSCPDKTFSSFKVENLTRSYWYIENSKEGCVGTNTSVKCYCNITMAFCRGLNNDSGCNHGDQHSSLCVQTFNGTGKNETLSYSMGIFVQNQNPFSTVSNAGINFRANFYNGTKYNKTKDQTQCLLQSEVFFECNSKFHWSPLAGKQKTVIPTGALTNITFDEKLCKLTIFVKYEGACATITPPSPHNESLSVGSVLIIMFVVVVSTYFLFGCTFKFCYGFRGKEVLPHSEFWIDLPVLIVDGFIFSCTCGKTETSKRYDSI